MSGSRGMGIALWGAVGWWWRDGDGGQRRAGHCTMGSGRQRQGGGWDAVMQRDGTTGSGQVEVVGSCVRHNERQQRAGTCAMDHGS